MDLGKLTRKKLPSSTFLPQAVMSFWAILSGCFLATTPSRPFTKVKINAFSLGALFDTGSTYSLAHAKWKTTLLNSHDQPCKGPLVKLCAANGQLLETCGTYRVQITINNKTFSHKLMFIEGLQVDCIIGMDLMAKANISIDTRRRKLVMGTPLHTPATLSSRKRIHLPAHSETMVNIPVPFSFTRGLVEGSPDLPQSVCLMEGIISSTNNTCRPVFANFGHLPVTIEANTQLGTVTSDPGLEAIPLSQCLAISTTRQNVPDHSHLKHVKLDHLPREYQTRYHKLLSNYADVFSKNDLDIGNCSSLPHVVRLKDRN